MADFPISESHFVSIKKILENTENLEDEWDEILLLLKLSGKAKMEVKKLKDKNANFGQIILKTLTVWRTEYAKEATFDKLVNAVSCNALATEELTEKKEEIRKLTL